MEEALVELILLDNKRHPSALRTPTSYHLYFYVTTYVDTILYPIINGLIYWGDSTCQMKFPSVAWSTCFIYKVDTLNSTWQWSYPQVVDLPSKFNMVAELSKLTETTIKIQHGSGAAWFNLRNFDEFNHLYGIVDNIWSFMRNSERERAMINDSTGTLSNDKNNVRWDKKTYDNEIYECLVRVYSGHQLLSTSFGIQSIRVTTKARSRRSMMTLSERSKYSTLTSMETLSSKGWCYPSIW